MKTYTNIEQVKADIKDGVFAVDDDIEIAFDSFAIDVDINCKNIYSKGFPRDIKARDINAGNIYAGCIDAGDINARDINARNISAWVISARDISATNIYARVINAMNINAENISYYGVCFAYQSFICKSVKPRRENGKHFCLDSEIKFIKDEIKPETNTDYIELNGVKYKRVPE